MTPAVLSMTPSAPGRIRTRDPLLRRSFHAGGQAGAFLFRAGLLVVWLQLNVWGFRPVLARTWHAPWVQTTGTALLAAVSADWYEQEHRQGTVDPDPSLVRHCHRVGCNALNRTRGSAGRPLLFFRPADQSPRPPPRLSLPPPAGERLPYPLRRQEALAYAGVRPIWARATCDRSHRRFSHILAFAIECAWPDPLFGSACLATLCRCRVGECL